MKHFLFSLILLLFASITHANQSFNLFETKRKMKLFSCLALSLKKYKNRAKHIVFDRQGLGGKDILPIFDQTGFK